MDDKAETVKVPCEVYSRIVGYLRPVQNWNEAKRQEFADRVVFRVWRKDEDVTPVPGVRTVI